MTGGDVLVLSFWFPGLELTEALWFVGSCSVPSGVSQIVGRAHAMFKSTDGLSCSHFWPRASTRTITCKYLTGEKQRKGSGAQAAISLLQGQVYRLGQQ